jgi:hypothetical protein
MSNYVKNYIASITNEDPSLQTSKILSKID